MTPAQKNEEPALRGWIALAVVTQPHGVSGRVKIKSLTDPAEAITKHKTLTDPSGREVKFRVTGEAQGQYIIDIEGLTRREEAELWRGRQLGLPRADLPALKKDNQFYAADLIGLCVLTADGKAFGTVHDVHNYGAGDLLEISRVGNGVKELYAFTNANFPVLDMAERKLIIDPPEVLGNRAEEEGTA